MRTREDLKPWLRKMPKGVLYTALIVLGIVAIPLACWQGISEELWPEFVSNWEAIGELE